MPGDFTVTKIPTGYLIGRAMEQLGPGPWWEYVAIVRTFEQGRHQAQRLAAHEGTRAWLHNHVDDYTPLESPIQPTPEEPCARAPMIIINPTPAEPLEAYLLRCLEASKRTRTTVSAAWGEIQLVIHPNMTAEQIRAACRGKEFDLQEI
jgi:hypothetical protein